MAELTIEYLEKDVLAPSDFRGCWVARFKKEGLTAYGNTINIATGKLEKMLAAWRKMGVVSHD